MRNGHVLLLLLVACGTGNSSGAETGDDQNATGASTTPPSDAEAQACQSGSVGKNALGDVVVHCTQPFASAPYVRLPDDAPAGANAVFYGAATMPTTYGGRITIWTRDGNRFVPVDASGKPLDFTTGKGFPAGFHAPTNRITFTIYQFTGAPGAATDSDYGPATAIQLTAVRPVVEIDGCAFDSRLLGTWDGTVSQRLETPVSLGGPLKLSFDEKTRVPIHVTLDTMATQPTLGDFAKGKRIADANAYMLNGVIDNFDKDVTVDGKTYASLSALGAKNPFYGATDGKVQLYRLGNMHGTPGDAHWVLTYPSGSQDLTGNGMSYSLTAFTAPWFFFTQGTNAAGTSADGTDPIGSVVIKPHIPYTTNGHSVDLTPIAIGAHVGQCPAN